MVYEHIRKELTAYYFEELPGLVAAHREKVYAIMDNFAASHPEAGSYALKAKMYEVIADTVTPRVFADIPFGLELGNLMPRCDGKYNRGGDHANGWLIERNMHLYADDDAARLAEYDAMRMYFVQNGTYADFLHMGIPMTKVFKVGLSGILQELAQAREKCTTPKETEFIDCAEAGIRALYKIAQRLSAAARENGMTELADILVRVPYEPPKTFHEGLNTLGFMRKALGSLEGYGFSSMGRPDVLLGKLYENDKSRCVTDEEMLDLVSRFLLIWDCTNDRRQLFEVAWEYELENTLTLGGCDEDGNPVFNGVTKLFITARDDLQCMYPKMMLRFSKNSHEEYLQLISRSLTKSQSYSLFENDDVTIPALVGCGTELKDARGYLVGGCWDTLTPDYNNKYSGEYFYLTTPFLDLMEPDGGNLKQMDLNYVEFAKAKDFDELYNSYLGVIGQILRRKHLLQKEGSKIWDQVSPACTLSALMQTCIDMRKDMTAGGIKYSREAVYYTCFAEIVDSLYAIKRLCFDEKVLSVSELIDQCRQNWPDEALRQKAIALPSFGDGSEESSRFAGKFYDDLCALADTFETAYGGKCRPGFNLYTEVVLVGEMTPALPSGRKKGDYLSQGITPSRLQKECSLYDFLDSYRYIDFTKTSGNASLTLTLPAGKIDAAQMASLFRVLAHNGLQAIQINCVDREVLLKAKKDPENHKDIVVRVCGFSAPFVCLSERYQDEIIARNISEV